MKSAPSLPTLFAVTIPLIFLFGCSPYPYGAPSQFSSSDVKRFSSTVRPYKGDPEAHYRLARYFQKRGKHGLAIEEFKKVIGIDPAHALAHDAMGVSLDMLGQYRQAEDAYYMALRINPEMASAENNLGYCLLLQGRIEEAIQAFRLAIALDAGHPRFHNNLALAYTRAGRLNDAYAEFKQAGGEGYARAYMARLGFADFESAVQEPIRRAEAVAGAETAAVVQPAADLPEPEPAAPFSIIGDPLLEQLKRAQREEEARTPSEIAPPAPEIRTISHEPEDAEAVEIQQAPAPALESGDGTSDVISTAPENQAAAEPDAVTCQDTNKGDGLSPDQKTGVDPEPETSSENLPGVIKIEVTNGNGVRGIAHRVGYHLRDLGFEVTRFSDANYCGHTETIIFYTPGTLQEAWDVAKQIPGYQDMREVESFAQPEIGVKVLLGKDIVSDPRCKSFMQADTVFLDSFLVCRLQRFFPVL